MRNLTRISIIVVVLAALFVSLSCSGFFVNQPNSISVTALGGATSFSAAPTAQLKATATFNSGTKDVTNSASWQSSSACASVSSTGLVTAVGTASDVTVSASLAGVDGTITGTTTGGTSQTLTITPTIVSLVSGSVQFVATDSNNNDVTASATWTSGNTSLLTFSGTPGFATLLAAGSTTVSASTASAGSSCASGTANVTIQ